MSSTDEVLARVKSTPPCLSHWQLSRWAMQLVSDHEAEQFATHVQRCDACTQRWQAERQSHAAAQGLALPAALRMQPRSRAWSWSWPGLAMVACAVLAVGLWALPGNEGAPQLRLKGQASLRLAVRRGATVQEGTWDQLQPLRPGDQVRLKAPSGTPTWQRLTVLRAGAWRPAFAGMVSADEWAPLGLTVNGAAPNDIRLVVCPAPPTPQVSDDVVPPGCTVYDTRF